jgi:rRNA maturation endonuclease Nob1
MDTVHVFQCNDCGSYQVVYSQVNQCDFCGGSVSESTKEKFDDALLDFFEDGVDTP